MSWLRFFRRDRWDAERTRELEAHLAIETDDNIARGMSPAAARDAARRKLGNVTLVREEIYRMNTLGLVETIWQDLRHGVRLLRLNPGFAAVAILSLALGVGANTAIFQLLDAVRLRALPVPRPEQLVEIRIANGHGRDGAFNSDHPILTNPLWERIRDRQEAFSGAFAWSAPNFELSEGGASRRAQGLWVGGPFFETLEVRPVLGRLLTAADDRPGCAAPPAVISYGFWQREYGGSPSALGRRLTLDGHAFDIVGVTPPAFFGVEVGRSFDVALPLCAEPFSMGLQSSWLPRKDAWFLAAIGRLKPGWTVEKATAHLDAMSAALFKETLPVYRHESEKAYLGFRLAAYPAGTGVSTLRAEYESPLWLLLATTALVLLIACANLANLMLARATTREREIAVRLAIGASRFRIVRQLLAESLLNAAAGAGAWLAQTLSRALVAALAGQSDRVFVDVSSDWRGLAFVALIGAAACVLFGLVPAIRATATSPGAAMKAGSRGATDSRERFGLRRALVVAQVALSLVLVVGALLFVRTFRNLSTLDAGFAREHIYVASLDLRRTGVPDERLRLADAELLDRLRQVPGVQDAAQARNVPLGESFSNRDAIVDGVARTEHLNFNAISDRYFSTMSAALLAGRDFNRADSAAAPRVAIVTESFARVFYNGASPIGRSFQLDQPPGTPRPSFEIVGLARDSKYGDMRDAFEPLMYVPVAQDDLRPTGVRLVIRSPMPAATVMAAVTGLARDIHPASIVTFRTLESQIADSLVRERLMATLSGFFGGLAALIATIGLYGVMSYTVARRRNEIGIRMALGAGRRDVVGMVMREAGVLLIVGVVLGTALAVVAARAAATLLFGLSPGDPATLAMAAGGLGLVAMLASYVPALRAARLEPTEALREE